jgi:hypothetical protein
MSDLARYSGNNYITTTCSVQNRRGQVTHGRNVLNNQLKMAEIEAGHMLREELHNTARGK